MDCVDQLAKSFTFMMVNWDAVYIKQTMTLF